MCSFKVHSLFDTLLVLVSGTAGLILQLLAVLSQHWSVVKNVNISKGLWETCILDFCFKTNKHDISELHRAAQILSGISLALAAVLLSMTPIHTLESLLIFTCGKGMHTLAGMIAFCCGITVFLLNLLTLAIWALGVHERDKYEFGQGMVMLFLAGFLLMLAGRETQNAVRITE